MVIHAFISAEDKNFYKHFGYDPIGLLKAISDVLRGKKLRGASTITQQVMKNFLLSSERTGKRKIKEIILASRIEKVLTKDMISRVVDEVEKIAANRLYDFIDAEVTEKRRGMV